MAIAGAANGVPQTERESRWLTRDGRERTVAWTATPILDQWGAARVLLSGADVTERKRQEEEVRASRSRIVAATDAARRRLERNLHDGAQQRLAALALSLRLAEAKLETSAGRGGADPRRSPRGAARGARGAPGAGARPPPQRPHRSRSRARARGARRPLADPGRRSTCPSERFPPAIEAAAYYVTAEALANVVKYAGATRGARADRRGRGGGRRSSSRSRTTASAGPIRALGSGLEGLVDRVETLDGALDDRQPARRRHAHPRDDPA